VSDITAPHRTALLGMLSDDPALASKAAAIGRLMDSASMENADLAIGFFIELRGMRDRLFVPVGIKENNWLLFSNPRLEYARDDARVEAKRAERQAARRRERTTQLVSPINFGQGSARVALDAVSRNSRKGEVLMTVREAVKEFAYRIALGSGASREIAIEFALDAALVAGYRLSPDLEARKECADHAEARWRVWRSGRGLFCDLAGDFYVYVPTQPRTSS